MPQKIAMIGVTQTQYNEQLQDKTKETRIESKEKE
jgi:hypothetical protein